MVNAWSSELSKLVANAMLAQRISSINTISAICDKVGADIDEVATAIGLDSRLGCKFLKAGLGFGGSCFKKDILSLVYLAQSLHLIEVADYWMSILSINDFQQNRLITKVVTSLSGALVGKKIILLGYTFKQDTNDTRESPAIHIIEALLHERPSEIAIYDPACSATEIKNNINNLIAATSLDVVTPNGPVEAYNNAYGACEGSRAVLIVTPWKQFFPSQTRKETENHLSPVPSLQSIHHSRMSDIHETDIMNHGSHRRASLTVQGHLALGNETNLPNHVVERSICESKCFLCRDTANPAASLQTHENIDWARVATVMIEPKWVFDGRNIVDEESMTELGFRVVTILGR